MPPIIIAIVVVAVILIVIMIITSFLKTVEAGTIRLVTKFGGNTEVYKGPGKSFEVPLLTTGTTIPSKAINIDLDIADQTADVDRAGVPRPIKVRVLASAIVSVGDSNLMILTAANKFFARTVGEQTAILSDLLDLDRTPRREPAQPRRTVFGENTRRWNRDVGERGRGGFLGIGKH